MKPRRRLVITVCPREPGVVVLPVRRGERSRRLNAGAISRHLASLVSDRRLAAFVTIREACAGNCHGCGPNVSLTVHPLPRRGERPDSIATGWRTYVSSLPTLDCLANILDDNLR